MGRDYDDRRGPPRDQRRPEPRVNPVKPGDLGLPEGLVSDVAQVAEALIFLEGQGINLLAPLTRIEFIPPGYRLAFRAVMFPFGRPKSQEDGWVNVGGKWTNGTWYEGDDGGYALHKAPLRQLAAAAGLSWRTVNRSAGEVNRWDFLAVGRIRNMDGQWREVSASKDLDLREDGPIAPAWHDQARRKARSDSATADARLLKAREYGGRMAESKAVNAMIRDALGLRISYPEALARRPFVFPLLVYVPETAEARQLQAAVELGVVDEVYGPASRGKVYAEAGTVIDATATETRALPDNGPDATPDFAAEAERLAQRERVERRPAEPPPHQRRAPSGPSREDLAAYCKAKGWHVPEDENQWRDLTGHVQGKGRQDFEGFMSSGRGPDSDPDW